jgi:hypothetical protein
MSTMNSKMKSKMKAVGFALLLGAASVAAAQTPALPTFGAQATSAQATRFADQLKQYQNLSSTTAGTYTFHPAPALGSAPQDAIGRESFAQRFSDMQAESSNDSSMWQETQPTFSAKAADPAGRETFAQEFAQMQALSSKSGQWAFPPGANVPADEANSTLVVAKPIAHPAQSPVLVSHK